MTPLPPPWPPPTGTPRQQSAATDASIPHALPVTPVITVVCTANICRSAMAEVLLQREVGNRAIVRSAGTWPNDLCSPHEAIELMEARGLDLARHRSRVITEEMARESALILTMERAHVAHVVSLVPDAFPRTFTLPDVVRRAEAIGPRGPRRSFDDWVRHVHGDRTARQVLALTGLRGLTGAPTGSDIDEIADPYGQDRQAFVRCAAQLEALLTRLVATAFPD